MDLHIHSPASKCYKRTLDTDENEYIRILDTALEKQLSIIAITDHNSVKGYFEIKKMLSKNKELANRYSDMIVLPGAEISIFGKHVLAIFPLDRTQPELDNFLYNIGIEVEEQGDKLADAYKVTPAQLLEEISKIGGVSLLAHVDASNGMMEKLLHSDSENFEMWLQKGKSLASIIKSQYLYGICLNEKSLKDKLEKDILNNIQYRRDRKIAILFCSDSHCADCAKVKADGQPIGSRYSVVKLSEISFHGLKISLQDSEVRIFDEIPICKHPHIIGVAVRGGYIGGQNNTWQCFQLNEALNCVIGARGTGKSTLLDIIQYTLFPETENDEITRRFDSSIVFLKYDGEIYSFSCDLNTSFDSYTDEFQNIRKKPSIYKLSQNGNFYNHQKSKAIYEELKNFSSIAYRQKDIFNYAQDEHGPLKVINNLLLISERDKYSKALYLASKKMNLLRENIDRINHLEVRDYLRSNNVGRNDYKEEINSHFTEIWKLKKEITCMRSGIIEKVNEILKGQVILTLRKSFTINERSKLTEGIVTDCRRKNNITYEKQKKIRDVLYQIVSNVEGGTAIDWVFPLAVLDNNFMSLAEGCFIPPNVAQELIDEIRPSFNVDICTIFPEDKIEFSYNVNNGISKKDKFLKSNMLSMGQKSVAMLLMILTAGFELGDNRPLIIDQPEDDLDNIYIYSSLVREFRKIKMSRQLILATHNANIPIAGDAENILILESSGENGFVDNSGSIDKVGISKRVLDILEGGREALDTRNMKYPPFTY